MSWLEPGGPAGPTPGARGGARGLNAKRGGENQREKSSVEAVMKKGRPAFGDLTNQARGGLGGHGGAPAIADKAEARAAKPLEQAQAPEPKPLQAPAPPASRQHSDKENDHGVAAMDECEVSPREAQRRSATLVVELDTDESDPLACAAIAADIMSNAFAAERLRRPRAYLGGLQRDLSNQMRGILVDWLVEVAQEYKLASETLFLTVDYLDRFLSAVPIQRGQLQLAGVACMLVASKFEEIFAPTVEEFCFITENTYTRQQLLEMERRVLDALDFQLAVPSIRFFQRRFVAAAAAAVPDPDPRLDVLAAYCAELALLDARTARFLPSMVAASSVLLALFCLSDGRWNASLEHHTSYAAKDLRECTCFLWQCLTNARSRGFPAVAEKYRSPKFGCISEAAPPPRLLHALFA